MTNDLTTKRQQYRDRYMESLAKMPDAPISPSEQSPQADRWWPGTQQSRWEKGKWVPAPDCSKVHNYGDNYWRPAGNNTHEHWEVPNE